VRYPSRIGKNASACANTAAAKQSHEIPLDAFQPVDLRVQAALHQPHLVQQVTDGRVDVETRRCY
jgi:hypothetical protein